MLSDKGGYTNMLPIDKIFRLVDGQSRKKVKARVHHVKGTINQDARRVGVEPWKNRIAVLMRRHFCVH
jgi:hypothetical protein